MKMTFNILNQSATCCEPTTNCFEPETKLPIAIIGAGPVGLAAAAQLAAKNVPFILLEKGSEVGANIRTWGHVKLFSPWKYNFDATAKELLLQSGSQLPNEDDVPTGQGIIDQYLKPLSELDQLKPFVLTNHRVISITRKYNDKMKNKNRTSTPFIIYADSNEEVKTFEARAVLDATGTWGNPNPAQGNGVWLPIEKALSERIDYHIPNCEENPTLYANKKLAVIGGGHSAINSLLNLVKLKETAPSTEITWILRKENVELAYGGEQSDALAERGALGTRIRQLVEEEIIKVITPFFITSLSESGKITIRGTSRNEEINLDGYDRLIVNAGSRPDYLINSELRLNIDPVTESVTALAPLIDPNVHSCGTVRPHGEEELRQPEENFYVVGAKSYGRAPTFLMATGYEQVRSITAYLTGDLESAKRVELVLPETGVCSSGISSCC
ncbi:NAD(P)-binding domain-containing protein [Ureibacillus acetophenoni]|uniref:Thioredoxin reductase n=1 Tax=Ureibacillus acetophenoni TaxID=614649 RepID=A0A285UDA8_9BACL|nr:NAD(P)-binding domain-containing protein [Ureibacillus acetophenoni]SOC39860.1 thioredoxin reductase [Ureibacillus acetophenoni]